MPRKECAATSSISRQLYPCRVALAVSRFSATAVVFTGLNPKAVARTVPA
jgi:hypothetical protein